LLAYCRQHRVVSVPRRTVQQYGPNGLRGKAAIDAAVKELDELGRARLVQEGRRKDIQINPSLLDGSAT
jgi:putative DNA primase/helicase